MCDIACMAAASAPVKKTLYCFRCKRTIEEGKPYQMLVLPSGAKVPVCSDDRECYRKEKKEL